MRPITFLTDYGLDDEFVGVCHAVIARIAPGVQVIDLAHGLPRHDVRTAALVLAGALPYAPAGVHLAVVDPGVGSGRRAVAVRTVKEGSILVGPDNGLLKLAIKRLGGANEAVDLAESAERLLPVSPTFYGRDVFAPVAARLARGAHLAAVGFPIDPHTLTELELPTPRIEADRVIAHALLRDRFGNLTLDLTPGEVGDGPIFIDSKVEVRVGERTASALFGRAFADVGEGELLLYEDSTRRLALAVNLGSAAELLGLEPDGELEIRAAR